MLQNSDNYSVEDSLPNPNYRKKILSREALCKRLILCRRLENEQVWVAEGRVEYVVDTVFPTEHWVIEIEIDTITKGKIIKVPNIKMRILCWTAWCLRNPYTIM